MPASTTNPQRKRSRTKSVLRTISTFIPGALALGGFVLRILCFEGEINPDLLSHLVLILFP